MRCLFAVKGTLPKHLEPRYFSMVAPYKCAEAKKFKEPFSEKIRQTLIYCSHGFFQKFDQH